MYLKILLTLGLGLAYLAGPAQIDLSKYSAAKRTKIAEEEQIASESDKVFQSLMTQGVAFFENNEFEKAIDRFEEAGERRPLNVYPPVMIEDVRLAMDQYVEEEPETEEMEEVVEEEPQEPELTAEERVEQMYQAELAKVYKDMPPPPKKEKTEDIDKQPERDAEGLIILGGSEEEEEEEADESVEEEEADAVVDSSIKEAREASNEKTETPLTEEVSTKHRLLDRIDEEKSIEEVQQELAESYPDGVTEETFSEGNRTITKRIVVKDGLGNEYRKVKHGWGGVFYFKNGASITERVWKEETVLD